MIITDKNKKYPKRLLEIKEHPKKLYVEGNIDLLNKNEIVAIVGTRKCTEYGKEQAKRFSNFLAKKDVCIISGLARGIDSIAHYYAKSEKGKTIAVIASGFNNIYPKENEKLFKEIIDEGGCVISEYEPNTEVNMLNFPKRNRIISGLAKITLVVEARYRSGSTITARCAVKQGRELLCIPGNIDKLSSYGTNKLISEGLAKIVISPQEIIEELNISEEGKITDIQLEDRYKEIYNQINDIPISNNEIARRIKKEISEINEILFMLEVDGFIKGLPGDKYVREY